MPKVFEVYRWSVVKYVSSFMVFYDNTRVSRKINEKI